MKIFSFRFAFLSLFIFLAFFNFSCSSSSSISVQSVENEPSSPSLRLAPDVTPSMLNASFWIKRAKNPFKIKMTREEIALWNREVRNICNPSDSDFFIISDLRRFDGIMSAAEIRSSMHRYPRNPWYKKVKGKNGEEIKILSQKDWRAVFEKMNVSRLAPMNYFFGAKLSDDDSTYKKDFPVRKGVCVRRGNLRLVPDDTFYTDDKDFWYDDIAQNSGILMNEPVLVLWESAGGDWYFVKTSYCFGWIHSGDVALCSDEEFERYFDYAEKSPDSFVTITSDRFVLPAEYAVPCSDSDFTGLDEFFMGTYLFTADWNQEKFEKIYAHREPYASYLVEIPYKKSNGNLGITYASLPAGKCTRGLLDYTQANVLNLAFKTLGARYGWGGMADSRDCSEYLQDIFRCFGFCFARNSRSQLAMSGKTVDFAEKSISAKNSLVESLVAGCVMGFPGHVFLYLGNVGGKNYVISALGAYYIEGNEDFDAIEANSVNINTLEVKRKNGKTWLEMLSAAKLLENDGSFSDNRITLNPKWQFAEFSKINSGTAFLYKSTSKKRRNIVVAVNAGHGTKGGTLVKTYSHPDKSPKVTGGTNALGAVESIAISDGMSFKDGKTESEVTLRTARLLKNQLLKSGFDVLMLRDSSDTQFDNIARTVIANNNAAIHIALHYDGDAQKTDKGVFYCSVPDGIKNLPNVKKHWSESNRLGDCLVAGLERQELTVYNGGKMDVDLTQTSYSTIPTVDIELGNQCTVTQTSELEKRAKGLLEGVELFFNK